MPIPRRRLSSSLLAATVAVAACAHSAPGPASLAPRAAIAVNNEGRELTADQQVTQALSRLTFGARPDEAARVRAVGVDRWIATQLEPERVPDEAAERMVAGFEMLRVEPGELAAAFRRVREARRQRAMRDDSASRRDARREAMAADPDLRADARRLQRAVAELQAAKVARAVVSERQLNEVMVDFWENHFSVFAGKGQTRLFLTHFDRDVIRPHALGKFRDLLGAVAKSPAMLFYLDNWQSAADSTHTTLAASSRPGRCPVRPARLGRAAARCAGRRQNPRTANPPPLTGLGEMPVQRPPRRPRGLNENYARELLELHTLGVDGGYSQHDVIEVARALTGWSIEPQAGEFVFRPAVHDADEKVVLGHRLRSGRGIDDGEQILDILAGHPATARHIARKLAVRFVSDSPPSSLVDRAAETFRRTGGDIREVVRTIVTSPEFFRRAAYKSKVKTPFELVTSALRTVNAEPDITPRTAQVVARLGQPIFGRQTPDGWPETGGEWMNTGAILNRINFGLALAGGQVPGATLEHWPQETTLGAASRDAQVEGVVRGILGGEASPETWTILRSGENPLGPRASLEGLAQIVGLALGAPEFQRK